MQKFFEKALKLDSEWKKSEYASVQKWITRLRRKGSTGTLRSYFKFLAWLVDFSGKTPDEFVVLPKEEVVRLSESFCDSFSERNAKASASNALKAVRSFLKANDWKVEELGLDFSYAVMKRAETVPQKEEVHKMAAVAGLKWRAIILCLFQSGLRNSALRALTYSMLKDQIESNALPIKVHVTGGLRKIVPDACKEGVDYWTFLGPQACEALRQYVAWRKEKYGKVEDDELLFPSEARGLPQHKALRKPLDQFQIVRIVRKAARLAGVPGWENIRAHSLRKTFRATLDAGYIDGGQMAEDDKEYLMGHRLSRSKEPYHNANVDTLAQRYIKIDWYPKSQISKDAATDIIKSFAKSLGVEQIDVKIAKLRETHPEIDELEAIGRLTRQQLGIKGFKANGGVPTYKTEIIRGEEQLVKELNLGWELVKELSDNRFLLRRRADIKV